MSDKSNPVVVWGVHDDGTVYPIIAFATVEDAKAHAAQLAKTEKPAKDQD